MDKLEKALYDELSLIIAGFNEQLFNTCGEYNHEYIIQLYVIHHLASDMNYKNLSKLCNCYINSINNNPCEMKLPQDIDFDHIIIPWRDNNNLWCGASYDEWRELYEDYANVDYG